MRHERPVWKCWFCLSSPVVPHILEEEALFCQIWSPRCAGPSTTHSAGITGVNGCMKNYAWWIFFFLLLYFTCVTTEHNTQFTTLHTASFTPYLFHCTPFLSYSIIWLPCLLHHLLFPQCTLQGWPFLIPLFSLPNRFRLRLWHNVWSTTTPGKNNRNLPALLLPR